MAHPNDAILGAGWLRLLGWPFPPWVPASPTGFQVILNALVEEVAV